MCAMANVRIQRETCCAMLPGLERPGYRQLPLCDRLKLWSRGSLRDPQPPEPWPSDPPQSGRIKRGGGNSQPLLGIGVALDGDGEGGGVGGDAVSEGVVHR